MTQDQARKVCQNMAYAQGIRMFIVRDAQGRIFPRHGLHHDDVILEEIPVPPGAGVDSTARTRGAYEPAASAKP
jgi:hypothetical protein